MESGQQAKAARVSVIYTVRFTPEAQQQLDDLEIHFAEAGSPIAAARYVDSSSTSAKNCKPSRTEARSATTFVPACGRKVFAGA